MFTTADLPATMQAQPDQPHTCGLPDCPLAEAVTGVPSTV